jgi:hypothetical protein
MKIGSILKDLRQIEQLCDATWTLHHTSQTFSEIKLI